MSILAIVLVVISAAMHAFRNFFTKRALDKQAFIWWHELLGLMFFSPILLFFLIKHGLPALYSLAFVVVSGIVHFFYWYFLAKSFEDGELSHVYPIMRSSPALVLILSVLILQEKVSLLALIGLTLVVVGVYSINLKKISLSHLLKPIRAILTEKAMQYAFLTLLSVSAYSIIDKLGVNNMQPVIFAGLFPFFSLSLFSLYITNVKDRSVFQQEWAARKSSIIICGFLGIFGYLLILLAFSIERVSYVVGLRQLSIVFAVFLGTQVLEEGNRMIRLVSSIVIFAGTFLIAVAD